jgi:hypothetical protein
MRALVTTLVLVLGACATPPPAAVETAIAAHATTVAPALVPGDVHVYALDWETEATRQLGSGQITGGLALRGELAVAAIDRDADGMRVALWFPSLETHRLTVQEQAMSVDPAMLVGMRAEILVADDGEVRRARFAADSPPMFRELMTGVIARLDLRAAADKGAPRRVRGGHGLVEVHYERGDDGSIARSLDHVLRFDTAPGIDVEANELVARGRFELDADRVPVRIELHDAALLGDDGLVADDRFSLSRVRVDQTAPPPSFARALELDPTAPTDRAAAEQALDRQFAAGTTMADVQITMNTMDGGVLPHQGEVSRAVALLRGWPENIDVLMPLVRAAGDNGRQLGFDLLAATGSAKAQAAMRELLVDEVVATSAAYPLLLQRFAFLHAPDAESGEFLLDRLAHARTTGGPLAVAAVLHPLGTVTGRVGDAALAERLHLALVDAARDADVEIRAAAISGLGNAQHPDDLDRILLACEDDDAGVRTEAVAALRTRVVPEATVALLEAIADTDEAVADRALTVLRERHFEGAADPVLVENARAGRYNARLDRAIATTIASHSDDAAVRAALVAIAARTTDPDLANQLGHRPL